MEGSGTAAEMPPTREILTSVCDPSGLIPSNARPQRVGSSSFCHAEKRSIPPFKAASEYMVAPPRLRKKPMLPSVGVKVHSKVRSPGTVSKS